MDAVACTSRRLTDSRRGRASATRRGPTAVADIRLTSLCRSKPASADVPVRSASASMCLSTVRSATRRFKRAFILERPQLSQLADAQVRVLLLPEIEGGFADPELPTRVRRRRPALDLPERVGDQLFAELRVSLRFSSFHRGRRRSGILYFRLPTLLGETSVPAGTKDGLDLLTEVLWADLDNAPAKLSGR